MNVIFTAENSSAALLAVASRLVRNGSKTQCSRPSPKASTKTKAKLRSGDRWEKHLKSFLPERTARRNQRVGGKATPPAASWQEIPRQLRAPEPLRKAHRAFEIRLARQLAKNPATTPAAVRAARLPSGEFPRPSASRKMNSKIPRRSSADSKNTNGGKQ